MAPTTAATRRRPSAARTANPAASAHPATHDGPDEPDAAHAASVRELAYALYERSGRVDGHALEHWLQAEAQVAQASAAGTGRTG